MNNNDLFLQAKTRKIKEAPFTVVNHKSQVIALLFRLGQVMHCGKRLINTQNHFVGAFILTTELFSVSESFDCFNITLRKKNKINENNNIILCYKFLSFSSLKKAERKQSLGYDWHPECLRCEECGKRLNPGQHAEVANIFCVSSL